MGEIADMVLEGVLCELCGVYIGEAVGFPRKCEHCSYMTREKPRKKKRQKDKKCTEK